VSLYTREYSESCVDLQDCLFLDLLFSYLFDDARIYPPLETIRRMSCQACIFCIISFKYLLMSGLFIINMKEP
jgi:hypothetical protein